MLDVLRPLLEDPAVAKLSARGKLDYILLARAGIALRRPALRRAAGRLPAQSRAGARRDRGPGAGAPGRAAAAHGRAAGGRAPRARRWTARGRAAAQEADLALRLGEPVARRLEEEGVASVYERMELPLVEVLADMERAGVKVNAGFLRRA